MDTTNNLKSSGVDDLNYHVVMAILEGFIIFINFLVMLFSALQIKIKIPILEIIPSMLIMLQVPLFPFLLAFVIYSLTFLSINKKVKFEAIGATKRRLIKIQIFYVFYFVVMFTTLGVLSMTFPQPK